VAILQTEAFKKKVKTMRDHRNRIKHAYKCTEQNYKGYQNKHICGRNARIICKSALGDPEDFANVCIDHKK